jgi:hypothetical protein
MSTDVTFSEEWLEEYCKRTGQALPSGYALTNRKPGAARTKYGNKADFRGNERFDSRHEAEVYDIIVLRWRAGEIRGFTRQQPFLLPGGVKYIADFVILNNDRSYTVLDAKSEATRKDKVYRLKRRQMKACLGFASVVV